MNKLRIILNYRDEYEKINVDGLFYDIFKLLIVLYYVFFVNTKVNNRQKDNISNINIDSTDNNEKKNKKIN